MSEPTISPSRSRPQSWQRKLLERLAHEDFDGSTCLLGQLESFHVSPSWSDSLSFLIFPENPVPIPQIQKGIPVEAEAEDTDGETISILLSVTDDGVPEEVMIYRQDGRPINIDPSSIPNRLKGFVVNG